MSTSYEIDILHQLKNAATTSPDTFIAKLKEFKECCIPESETYVYNALLRRLRAFVADEQKSANSLNQYLTSIFAIISDMPLRRQCTPFSALINAVLHHAKTWDGVGLFAYWCGLECLRPEDFESFVTAEGKKLMSLAEQLDCRIGRYLLESHDKQKICDFLPAQEQITVQHPEYTYPPYYLAKMYVKVGNYAQAQSTLIPFVRRKSQEFWVWELLAESTQDSEAQLAFYCKALSCRTKDAMRVGLLQNAAAVFARVGCNNDARYLIDEASRIRQANHWALPHEMLDMMRQPWYAAATSLLDKQWIAQQTALAEKYVPIRKKPTNSGNRQTNHQHPAETKHFSGKLKLCAGGFGFVNDEVYIPANLLTHHRNGDMVSGLAEKRMNLKKNKWGFVAVQLDK